MTQKDKALAFAGMHRKGKPVVLYNIWDAGSARVVGEAGAQAIATGSASVAAAQGYGDGEAIPLAQVEHVVKRIVATVDLPLTLDFEGGYAQAPDQITANVSRMVEAGVIGVNFEDQIVGTSDLYPIDVQASRVAAVRKAGNASNIPLVVNARTDLFLKERDPSKHGGLLAQARERAAAYAAAGASSFFVPGLAGLDLISDLVASVELPVNIMMLGNTLSIADLSAAGVARISFGPGPYRLAMKRLASDYLSATTQADV